MVRDMAPAYQKLVAYLAELEKKADDKAGARENARRKLGDKFDIRALHDQVLKAGAMPLDILEERIGVWVAEQSTDESA